MTQHQKIHPTRLPHPQMCKVADLRPAPRNARSHSRKQLSQIADSIRAFGFTNPVLIDQAGQVIAGHGRLAAAQLLGLELVPTLCLDWLSDAEQRAYLIADNRLAERAGWDRGLLAIELGELCDLDIDETLTGFDLAEIELILDAGAPAALNDEVPDLNAGAAVCQPGDLWQLGRHRLLCGNALDHDSYRRLMGRDRARVVVTDPPYNVPIGGNVSGLGKVRHREFVQGSGEMSDRDFLQFLTSALGGMAKVSREARCTMCSWTGAICPS
jgi:hypothetical protein